MRAFKFSIVIALIISLTASPVFAYGDLTGTTSANFLKIIGSVRAAGMGNTFVAVADDVSAVFWNPAGLMQMRKSEISSMYTSWLADVSIANVSGAFPLGRKARWGFSLSYVNIGQMEETTVAEPAGTGRYFTPNDYMLTFSYSQKVFSPLLAGFSISAINETIDKSSVAGWTMDAGLLYRTPVKSLTAGLAIKNMGSLGEENILPTSGRVGLAYRPLGKFLTFACDLDIPTDNVGSVHAGIEYFPIEILALRVGGSTLSEDNAGGNMGGGIGLRWNDFGIDYAYAPYGDLGQVQRVSINLCF